MALRLATGDLAHRRLNGRGRVVIRQDAINARTRRDGVAPDLHGSFSFRQRQRPCASALPSNAPPAPGFPVSARTDRGWPRGYEREPQRPPPQSGRPQPASS